MKEIFKRITRIILVSTFAITVIPMCVDLSNERAYALEMVQNNSPKLVVNNVEDLDFNNAYPISDDQAIKHLTPGIYEVKNLTGKAVNYNFGLKVNKETTLSLDFLRLQVNGKIVDLVDTKCREDEEFTYFCLENSVVTDTEEISILMWLKDTTDNSAQGKKIIYSLFSEEINNSSI